MGLEGRGGGLTAADLQSGRSSGRCRSLQLGLMGRSAPAGRSSRYGTGGRADLPAARAVRGSLSGAYGKEVCLCVGCREGLGAREREREMGRTCREYQWNVLCREYQWNEATTAFN